MTLRPTNVRNWFIETAAAVLLGLPAALIAMPADAAATVPLNSVYPRAGVSSDAYRTPPQLISHVNARPITVRRRSAGEPAQLTYATNGRRQIADAHVVPIAHTDVEPVSRVENRQSVQAELRRLYAEDGRQMPHMSVPSYTPTRRAAETQSSSAHVAPALPVERDERSPGLLAGLFDFGRSKTRRSRNELQQPPAEPVPFRPPSFRQQPRQLQPQQRQAMQTPNNRALQSRAPIVPPAAPPATGNAMINLKSANPNLDLGDIEDDFFPSDGTGASGNVGQAEPATTIQQEDSDFAEFFPSDAPVTASIDSAANRMKDQMQGLLQEQRQTQADEGDFKLPVATQEPIVPQPAPAAVTEIVTTQITPSSADPDEPAPFFADEERAINPEETMEVAKLEGQTFDPSGADSEATAGVVADSAGHGSRMQQIAARDGVGLKGYCPVALRDERRLADGKAAFVSYFEERAYYLSSAAARQAFENDPASYAPASSGVDVTMMTLTGEVVDGSLDHSVWYKGRLYLFHSADNLKTFMAAPSAMAVVQ